MTTFTLYSKADTVAAKAKAPEEKNKADALPAAKAPEPKRKAEAAAEPPPRKRNDTTSTTEMTQSKMIYKVFYTIATVCWGTKLLPFFEN